MKIAFTLLLTTLLWVGLATATAPQALGADALESIFPADSKWEVAVDGLGFADGLSCDAEGNLYFGDLRGDKAGVYRLAPDGTKTRLSSTGRSGTRVGPDGRLYSCGGKSLVAFDLAAGTETTILDNIGTNDLAVSPRGHVYITDTGKKQVTQVVLKTSQARPGDVGIAGPNGIGLSPDGSILYVSDYNGIHVYAFKVQPDGALGDKREFATMKAPPDKPNVAGGDGMTVDAEGRLYVTTALGLQVFDAEGHLLGVVPKPANAPLVSAGFAGKDLATLYVACGDKIYRRSTRVKGAAPPRL